MKNDEIIDAILAEPAFSPYIAHIRTLEASLGTYTSFPEDLDPRLASALRNKGIHHLYTHQEAVWKAARSGKHSIVVTPTASGKTLCYNLPTLQSLLEDSTARALYLFPTKALSQDQQAELNELVLGSSSVPAAGSVPLPIKVATYDGDTPDSLRVASRDSGRIIVSNPDMLHAGILPNHPKWIKFFSNLHYVVIDEAHTYRGIFGSHVANVIRRLKRIAAFYGSKPVFILCSATIGNPKELAQMLIEEELVLVGKSGAPRGKKKVILYNPPLLDAVQGIRRSVMTESQRWALAFLRAGIKTILFAHSRVRTEVVASYINQELANIFTDNEHLRVEAYRGGLLPLERRSIEKGLRDSSVQGVVSTNALELGIDIGGLDAAVVAGFPGSFNSFWQQAGRAGRRGGTSLAVFVATSSPLDQFVIRNPDWFFDRPSEEARLDADNPYVLSDHVKCAAFELPFSDGDIFGTDLISVLSFLEEEGTLRKTGAKWYWADRSYPAESISLRSASADNVVIIDETAGKNIVIGEMDRPSAKELVFENAVYIHRGRQYLVKELDIQNRRCIVVEAEVNYFTDALVKTDIKTLSEDEHFVYGMDARSSSSVPSSASSVPNLPCTAHAVLADVLVRSQVAKFKKIRFQSHENIGYGDIDQNEEETQTRAIIFLFPPESREGEALASSDATLIGAALSALGQVLKRIAPMYLLCDARDLGLAERVRDPHFNVPALYIYDRYPGGTGLAEAIASRAEDLFSAVYKTVKLCPCVTGCPSCIGAQTELMEDESQSDVVQGLVGQKKMAALTFLESLVTKIEN